MAGIGSMVRVNGRRSAAPVVAFNPGSAPITTPPTVATASSSSR